MTNLLVQSVDTMHFYHFLSTGHNCVQITLSQGNSHKIMLSIKINVTFYFWGNKGNRKSNARKEKPWTNSVLWAEFLLYRHHDRAAVNPHLNPSGPYVRCQALVLLMCFPPHPSCPMESKRFTACFFQWSSVTDTNHESQAECQEQELQKPIKHGERCSVGLGCGQGVEQRAWWQGWGDKEVSSSSCLPDRLCCWSSGDNLPKTWSTSPLGRW